MEDDDELDRPVNPSLPELRAFKVLRAPYRTTDTLGIDIEETVFAHNLNFSESGALLFSIFKPTPDRKIVVSLSRVIHAALWMDVAEVSIPTGTTRVQ